METLIEGIIVFFLAVGGLAIFIGILFAVVASVLDVEEEAGDPYWGGKADQWTEEQLETLLETHKKMGSPALIFNKITESKRNYLDNITFIKPTNEPDEHENQAI